MRGGLVLHTHTIIIPAALFFPLLRDTVIGGAPTTFQNDCLSVHRYICMYTTSGGRSRGKVVSSLRKRFGARQRNPLYDYLYVYICIYIYTHTLVVTVLCEILSIRYIFCTTLIFVRLL